MKPNTVTATNGHAPSPDKTTSTRGRKPAKRKITTASRPAARGAETQGERSFCCRPLRRHGVAAHVARQAGNRRSL
jgi:hypothetical protein